jgi:hypothetical protein
MYPCLRSPISGVSLVVPTVRTCSFYVYAIGFIRPGVEHSWKQNLAIVDACVFGTGKASILWDKVVYANSGCSVRCGSVVSCKEFKVPAIDVLGQCTLLLASLCHFVNVTGPISNTHIQAHMHARFLPSTPHPHFVCIGVGPRGFFLPQRPIPCLKSSISTSHPPGRMWALPPGEVVRRN